MNKLSQRLIYFVIFLVPLFFLPVTRDFFTFNKNVLLMFFALSLTVVSLLKTAIRAGQAKADAPSLSQYLNIVISPLTLPILSIAAAYLLSLLISSPNKVEALLQPAGAGTIFALTLIYFLLKQNKSLISQYRNIAISPLLASSIILSLITIIFTALDSFGIKTLSLADFQIAAAGFTPAGSSLSLASFLLVSLVISLVYRQTPRPAPALNNLNNNETTRLFGGQVKQWGNNKISQYLNILISIVILLALLSSFSIMIRPENRPRLLPVSAGWQIAVENFKTPKTALFGVGPGNFVNAFTRTKPIELNQGDLWPFRFGLSSNFYFQVLTEIGILGLAAFLWLIYKTVTPISQYRNIVISIFLILALIPANILLLFVLYLFLAEVERTGDAGGRDPAGADLADLRHEEHQREGNLRQDPSSIFHDPQRTIILLITLLILLLITFAFYLLIRAYTAETTMFRAVRAAAQNRAQETYDLQRESLRLNPYSSDYRIIFAQTNLALANNMAANPDLTDVDRQTVNQLVNQAIVNAKLAVQLTPGAATWENLAAIYQALINVAQGADAWAVAAYNQAVALDPANPALRVAFGGLYYALQAFDPAIRQFETAIFLRRDFANAWYNLAVVQREAQRIDQSRFSYQQILALLDPTSNDYEQVKKELEALPKPPTASPSAQLETLTPPASPAAELEPPLELGEEAAPPAEFLSPTPIRTSPAVSPITSPTLSPAPTIF